jgi:predicted DNA-binding protein (MmcQ/YjbR family)
MDSIMDIELLRAYLLKKKGASEEFPFGPEVMVFKVRGKMFALVFLEDSPLSINLKCDPDLAMHLRGFYNVVQPGYHMNKKHWNTIILDGSIPDDEIFTMISESYDLVVKGLKKADRKKLEKLSED